MIEQTNLVTFEAKDLFKAEPHQLNKELGKEKFPMKIIFPDGELITNSRETAISNILWDVIRQFNQIPLSIRHHLGYHLKGKRLKNNSHLAVYQCLHEDVTQVYPEFVYDSEMKFAFNSVVNNTHNDYYNYIISQVDRYHVTLDAFDFIDIVLDEGVKEIKVNGDYSQRGILKIHKDILKYISTKPELKENNIVRMFLSGMIKPTQLSQCIGPYGYAKDIDSRIFPIPIIGGYCEGLRGTGEQQVESRSATMALMFAKSQVADVEYTSRKSQLSSQNLMRVHRGDCGSDYFLTYEMPLDKKEFDKVLNCMQSIYYKTDKDSPLKYIKGDEEHLQGRTIYIRTPFGCTHPDHSGICEICAGKITNNLMRGMSPGKVSSTNTSKSVSQNTISTKHIIVSAVQDEVNITPELVPFFKPSSDKLGYNIKQELLENTKVKLIINKKDIHDLSSILSESVTNISPSRVSEIKKIVLIINDDIYKLNMNPMRTKTYCSVELLAYMKQYVQEDNRGNYVVDLSKWKANVPLFRIPVRQFSTVDFSKGIENFTESPALKTNVVEHIKNYVNYIQMKMSDKTAMLLCNIYTTMVASRQENNYRLPKATDTIELSKLGDRMIKRSLSAHMAFQNHTRLFNTPTCFTDKNRPDHPFDAFVVPETVRKVDARTNRFKQY